VFFVLGNWFLVLSGVVLRSSFLVLSGVAVVDDDAKKGTILAFSHFAAAKYCQVRDKPDSQDNVDRIRLSSHLFLPIRPIRSYPPYPVTVFLVSIIKSPDRLPGGW